MTDYGEVGPHSKDLLEWIVHQFKIKCEDEGRRSDGCVASLVRDFRNELHTNVQMAIAAGCGEMLRRQDISGKRVAEVCCVAFPCVIN